MMYVEKDDTTLSTAVRHLSGKVPSTLEPVVAPAGKILINSYGLRPTRLQL